MVIDIGAERSEVQREILMFVSRNEGTLLTTIATRLHMPPSMVKREVHCMVEMGALRVEYGKVGEKYYIARMHGSCAEIFEKIELLAHKGVEAAHDHAPIAEKELSDNQKV
jgi:DNA-binding MarR family transcriptional regulator